nr:neural cell adhesion molecule - mouse (fragments) [Mus musculus]
NISSEEKASWTRPEKQETLDGHMNMEGIVTIMGLKPETRYSVRLAALNGKGLGEISAATEFKTQPVHSPPPQGEPSAPKLEGQMGEDGNSIKVNLIKQDDGGSPIRHYLVKYRA